MVQALVKSDVTVVKARGGKWSEWLCKVIRIDFIQSDVLLKRAKQLRVCATAGTERFKGESGDAGLAKVGKEQ